MRQWRIAHPNRGFPVLLVSIGFPATTPDNGEFSGKGFGEPNVDVNMVLFSEIWGDYGLDDPIESIINRLMGSPLREYS